MLFEAPVMKPSNKESLRKKGTVIEPYQQPMMVKGVGQNMSQVNKSNTLRMKENNSKSQIQARFKDIDE